MRNSRPFTSATSTGRSTPLVNASSAPTTSCRSTPTSSAKWLRVPAGMQTNGSCRAAACAATIASDPSPPATPSASAPFCTAASASPARFCPWARTTASIPSARARSASLVRAAAPPPDLGLMNSTGRRGGSASRQPRPRSFCLAPTGADWGCPGDRMPPSPPPQDQAHPAFLRSLHGLPAEMSAGLQQLATWP